MSSNRYQSYNPIFLVHLINFLGLLINIHFARSFQIINFCISAKYRGLSGIFHINQKKQLKTEKEIFG